MAFAADRPVTSGEERSHKRFRDFLVGRPRPCGRGLRLVDVVEHQAQSPATQASGPLAGMTEEAAGRPPRSAGARARHCYSGVMRVFLITGASSGIGAATARTIAAPQTAIALHARKNRAGAERVAQAIGAAGGETLIVEGDLAQPGTATRLVEE